jgi:hypothetical protein
VPFKAHLGRVAFDDLWLLGAAEKLRTARGELNVRAGIRNPGTDRHRPTHKDLQVATADKAQRVGTDLSFAFHLDPLLKLRRQQPLGVESRANAEPHGFNPQQLHASGQVHRAGLGTRNDPVSPRGPPVTSDAHLPTGKGHSTPRVNLRVGTAANRADTTIVLGALDERDFLEASQVTTQLGALDAGQKKGTEDEEKPDSDEGCRTPDKPPPALPPGLTLDLTLLSLSLPASKLPARPTTWTPNGPPLCHSTIPCI